MPLHEGLFKAYEPQSGIDVTSTADYNTKVALVALLKESGQSGQMLRIWYSPPDKGFHVQMNSPTSQPVFFSDAQVNQELEKNTNPQETAEQARLRRIAAKRSPWHA